MSLSGAAGSVWSMAWYSPIQMGNCMTQRAEAPDWVYPVLLVNPHGLLRDALPVLGVLLLYLLDLGLNGGHGLELFALAHGEREHDHAHEDGERQYGEAKAVEEVVVEHHQAVYHWPDEDRVPYVYDYFQVIILRKLTGARLVRLRRVVLVREVYPFFVRVAI